MNTLSRRNFLKEMVGLASATLILEPSHLFENIIVAVQTTQTVNAERFFTVGQYNGRWWFITPKGKTFFSIGLNHIDSATLRYRENVHI